MIIVLDSTRTITCSKSTRIFYRKIVKVPITVKTIQPKEEIQGCCKNMWAEDEIKHTETRLLLIK